LKCLKTKMTGTFRSWRDETGRRDAGLKDFPRWLKSKGCYDAQTSTLERYWHGVAFTEDQPQPSQLSQPPFSANNAVDIQYSKSTDQFHETGGYSGCDGCAPQSAPPDALLKLLADGGAGRPAADLRERLGWTAAQFSAIKADLLAAGRIKYEHGGWHLAEGAA